VNDPNQRSMSLILHVDTARSWRGGQNQVLLTAQGLRSRGHQVALACRAGGELEARARAAALSVRPLPFRGDLWPPAVTSLAAVLREVKPRLLHLHDPHAVSAGLLARRLASPVKAVATRRVDFPLKGAFSRAKYRACERVIAVSSAIRKELVRSGLHEEQVRLVHEGVPDRAPRPDGRAALRELGVPEGAQVVGNVAALTDHKDHATLLEAAALVVRVRPETSFVIAGEGERRQALLAQRQRLGLADHVVFAGFRDDLDRLLPAFDVFCLSSHLEGLGTSLLDAMAFARPIVATAAGGIPDAVVDGLTGRLVPVRDPESLAAALLELLGDPERRAQMGDRGRRRFLEHFTLERMVEDTLGVYAELWA
jgi:glycosyltransferase involved in cell wall biosynthesis